MLVSPYSIFSITLYHLLLSSLLSISFFMISLICCLAFVSTPLLKRISSGHIYDKQLWYGGLTGRHSLRDVRCLSPVRACVSCVEIYDKRALKYATAVMRWITYVTLTCYAILYYPILSYTIPIYYAMLYYAMLCHAMLYHAMLCCSSLWCYLLNKFFSSTSLFSVWCTRTSIIEWIRPALSPLARYPFLFTYLVYSLSPFFFLSLNHSCIPNVQQTHVPSSGCEVLHASRKIEIGKCHALATYLYFDHHFFLGCTNGQGCEWALNWSRKLKKRRDEELRTRRVLLLASLWIVEQSPSV